MNRINLELARSLIPPVYHQLATVKEGEFAYRHYGLRHPGGVFSIQFSDALGALNHLTQQVNNLQAVGGSCADSDTEGLKTLTRTFLFQLMNFFESGYEVFLAFCEPLDRPRPGQPLYRWFEENGYENDVDQYFANVNPTLKRYRDFFNALKHSSNRAATFQFINPQNSGKAIGFYLEGIDANGAVGPVLSLHPMHDDMHTAWSYNLHLRAFYFLVYQIAQEMEATIRRLLASHNVSLNPCLAALAVTNMESLAATAMTNATRFEKAFDVFYPQEGTETVRSISLNLSEGWLEFTEDIVGSRVIGHGWRVLMMTKGDGFSRTFRLPYFKQRRS